MSGDVQPRKRKEKKKRKDDGPEETQQQLHHYQHPPSPTITDDVNIHVEKELVTGGGVCAKIVFFFLLTALAVLIGLIITEHRELSDLDTVNTDSRFSKIFAGWTDNSPHDDHDDHLEADSHQSEEDSVEETSEHDNDDTDEDEEEDVASEEEAEEEEEEKEEQDDETEEQADDEEINETESAQEDDESENLSRPEEDEEEDEQQSEETYEESEEEQRHDDDEDGSDEIEQPQSEEANDDDDKEESAEDDSEEATREERDVSEEQVTEDAVEDDDAPPQTSGTGSVAVKVGVGVSIVVVAYVVLVRKWKSDSGNSSAKVAEEDAASAIPDLSRRNTIVPPPSLEEVEQDMENIEEDYSDEEADQESDENVGPRPSAAKQKYRELQSTYSRSFTPDSDTGQTQTDKRDYYQDDDGEEYEEEEDEDEEISENDDDEELLKKLEAKYGKLRRESNDEDDEDEEDDEEGEVDDDDNNFFTSWKRVHAPNKEPDESDSEREEKSRSGAQSIYDYNNITNTADYAIRDELDEAQREIYNNTAFALKLFDAILQDHPSSPRALYGRAQALDALAEIKKSNNILLQAISAYVQTLNALNVPDALFHVAAEKCIQRMHFIGRYGQAVAVHQMLINRFPDIPKFRNQLAITYLTINKIDKARRVLQETLAKWPNNGVALVHYGFILKTSDSKFKEAIYYMRKGIKTKEEGVIDGRFYFHLGDAMARLGRTQQAMELYEEGVKEKVFLSKYQRSLYNVPRLTGRPWWRKEETPYTDFYKTLESHWKEIRNEGLAVLNGKGYFKDESENLKDVGDWKQFELYARGMRNKENCKKCPITCQIIGNFNDASGCKRGQSKFSVIHPGTHVWPHCGPTNCRLRVHLGLKVPPETYIRVAEETRSWREGKIFIFDDSFEHEVWHNGTEFRLVLIVDVWHPELSALEKKTLTPI